MQTLECIRLTIDAVDIVPSLPSNLANLKSTVMVESLNDKRMKGGQKRPWERREEQVHAGQC
jgi:hypothetical protein